MNNTKKAIKKSIYQRIKQIEYERIRREIWREQKMQEKYERELEQQMQEEYQQELEQYRRQLYQ